MQRINSKFAVTLTAIMLFQNFGSVWPSGEDVPATPALPIRMSSLPWRSCKAAPSRATDPEDASTTKARGAVSGFSAVCGSKTMFPSRRTWLTPLLQKSKDRVT